MLRKQVTDPELFFSWKDCYACQQCGRKYQLMGYSRSGSAPRFCSSACKQKAYRKRKSHDSS